MISANVLSNNILKRAFTQNVSVTPMKLQKLLYITYKKYLQETGKRIFAEDFLAWKYGPVVQSVYDEFQYFKGNPITKFSKNSNGDVSIADEKSSPTLSKILNDVWREYSNYSGIELSNFTHQEGTAWYKATESGNQSLNYVDIKQEEDFITN